METQNSSHNSNSSGGGGGDHGSIFADSPYTTVEIVIIILVAGSLSLVTVVGNILVMLSIKVGPPLLTFIPGLLHCFLIFYEPLHIFLQANSNGPTVKKNIQQNVTFLVKLTKCDVFNCFTLKIDSHLFNGTQSLSIGMWSFSKQTRESWIIFHGTPGNISWCRRAAVELRRCRNITRPNERNTNN